MWTELLVIILLCAVAYFGYQAMQPAETCGMTVLKPANGTNELPKIDLSCKRVV